MVDVSKKNVVDYEKHVDKTKELSQIKISNVVKISYYGNGTVDVYYSYSEKPVNFSIIKSSNFFDSLETTSPSLAESVGISKEKIADVEK